MGYGISTSSWKPRRRLTLDLVFTMRDIWINSNLNKKLTSSSRSSKFKDILPWNIFQMITKTIPIKARIVIRYAIEMRNPLLSLAESQWNWENNMIRISHWRKRHCRTNTSLRKNKSVQKSRTVRVTARDSSRKVNLLNKVIGDRQIITEFTRSISSTGVG